MLSRRYHGLDLSQLTVLTSSECFVLEMVIDNLNYHPQNIKPMIEDLLKRRKDFKNMVILRRKKLNYEQLHGNQSSAVLLKP